MSPILCDDSSLHLLMQECRKFRTFFLKKIRLEFLQKSLYHCAPSPKKLTLEPLDQEVKASDAY